MKIYKAVLYGGYVGLLMANSLEEARKSALSEQGSSNVQSVSLASEDDINWVKTMGGFVPELPPRLASEWACKGYYLTSNRRRIKIGQCCDYYDRNGIKRSGTIKAYDGDTITIAGERTVIVDETFKVKREAP